MTLQTKAIATVTTVICVWMTMYYSSGNKYTIEKITVYIQDHMHIAINKDFPDTSNTLL